MIFETSHALHVPNLFFVGIRIGMRSARPFLALSLLSTNQPSSMVEIDPLTLSKHCPDLYARCLKLAQIWTPFYCMYIICGRVEKQ